MHLRLERVLLVYYVWLFFFFFSSRRRHTRCSRDWSSDVCSSDLLDVQKVPVDLLAALRRELVGKAIGDRLGDHRLAASGRPVEEHALGGPELVDRKSVV